MKSELHSRLQIKALSYLQDKQYWIKAIEMPTPVGIIDAWGISNVNNYETAAIEVKVSRNDYKSRSQKNKEFSSEHIANYCYILCPAGIVADHESPNWGILWYYENTGRLKLIRKPIRFDMTDKAKLAVMIHFFNSGINNPEKLLNNPTP